MSNPQKKMKKMKKFLLSLGLVAMMLNLTNCAQYEDVNTSVDVKGDFELYASISRTANDGLNTVWSADDALNVFHAVTDMTTYTNDGQFKLESGSADRFLGKITGTLDVEEEYDWYAFYPYSSYITTPANNSAGYTYIGSRSDAKQTQNGNNSMAHIAGSNYPMAGYAKAVGAASSPTVVFNHIASLVEFEVVNKLSEAITVNEIAFTAEEDIVGAYYVNFADFNNLQFTKYNNYQSNTATLTVSNGTAIEAGASAKFYLAVKPFTAEAGSELAVKVSASVNGNELSYSKTINVAAATTFSAGKIKPIAVKYNVELPSAEEIIETIDFSKQGYANAYEVESYAGQYCNITFSKGANSSSTPKYYTTGTAVRCYGGNTFTIASTKSIVKVVFSFATGEGTNAITATPGTFATDTWTGSANSVAFTIGGSTGHRRIQKIQITYVDGGETPETPETPATPVLSVEPATLSFEAAGGSKTVACTIENEVEGVEVTATENVDWLTTSVSGKTVTITATENTASSERTATVTIAYEGAESKTVTVKQSEPIAAGAEIYTLLGEKLSNTASYTTSEKSITADDGSVWKIWGYYKNTTDIFQLGAKSKNYLLTPACTSDITTIEIACSGNYTVALWNPSTDELITGMVAKPSKTTTDATGSIKFTLPAGYKQVKIISTRTAAGTGITTSNAACYIKKVVVTAQ